MSVSQNVKTLSVVAGSTIDPFRFIVLATDDGLFDHVGTAQADFDGISNEAASAGEALGMVQADGCVAKVEAGAVTTLGGQAASDNVGRAIDAVSGAGNMTAGKFLDAAGAAGDIVRILFLKDRDQA
jgi:hypothetical protein